MYQTPFHIPYTGKFWAGEKLANLPNCELITNFFFANIPFGKCTDCSLFTKFSLPIAFTCMVYQNFPCTVSGHVIIPYNGCYNTAVIAGSRGCICRSTRILFCLFQVPAAGRETQESNKNCFIICNQEGNTT